MNNIKKIMKLQRNTYNLIITMHNKREFFDGTDIATDTMFIDRVINKLQRMLWDVQ